MISNARKSPLGPRVGAVAALTIALALIFIASVPASAQNDPYDPPVRVARVNFLQGSVSFQPAGVDEWVDVSSNRPLSTGDALWLDADSRAELHVGSTVIQLNQYTSFSFLNLSSDAVQMQLTSGSLNLHVRYVYGGENYEVDTPNLAFTALQPGDYRIDTDPNSGLTSVTVRRGQGLVTGGGQSFYVDAGTQAQVSGTDELYYDIYNLPGPDAFDQWALSRDRNENRSLSARYVSRDLTGYEDLDRYGHWFNVPNLGFVWQPNTFPDNWAPVRDGHWAWIDPWGWTWVDNQPWGFVTSHYGRWTYVGNGWAWVPPVYTAPPPPNYDGSNYNVASRPVYAPSLVVFVGGGSLNLSFGSEGVAWFPLAPGEPYIPPYQASAAYVRNVNTTNTVINQTTITNILNQTTINNTTNVNNTTNNAAPARVYANQRVANAVTAVPKAVFVNAQSVGKAAVAVPVQAASAARTEAMVKVAPVQASVLGTSKPAAASVAKPPAAIAKIAVVAKVAPPPPPVSFATKQQALTAHPGRPVDIRTQKTLAAANPAPVRVVKTAPPAAPVKAAAAQVHQAAPPPATTAPTARPTSAPPPVAAHPAARPVTPAPANPVAKQQTTPPPASSATKEEQQKQMQARVQAQRDQAQREQAQRDQMAHPAPPAAQPAVKPPATPPSASSATKEEQQKQMQAREQAQREQAQRDQMAAHPAPAPPAAPAHPTPPPPGRPAPPAAPVAMQPVHVPENVQQGRLVSQPKLEYPPEAQRARVQGAVQVQAVIGTDGRVKSAKALSGPAALHAAAVQNVSGRQYNPTVVNGKSVEVTTEITVDFKLPK